MRSHADRLEVTQLSAAGLSDYEVSRRTGVPRSTVQRWRIRGDAGAPGRGCPLCDGDGDLPHQQYAYLLGLYLGDGWIGAHRREVHRLNIYLDAAYPHIIDECATAMAAVRPGQHADRYKKPGAEMVIVRMYSRHWPCLFPQHSTGTKHTRPIVLADWQQAIVDEQPEALLRGLIHSDGCRVMNRATMPKKTYFYPRYQFSNRSQDIHAIFRDACERVGVQWRASGRYTTNVSRRASVAELDRFIGPKS